MKTTLDGLTYLINMLVDVVNLQRKAQGTPGARCDVELAIDEYGQAHVHFSSVVNLAAPPLTALSADNNSRTMDRMLTPADIQAAERAFSDSRFDPETEEPGMAREAVENVLRAVGLLLPDRTDYRDVPDRGTMP